MAKKESEKRTEKKAWNFIRNLRPLSFMRELLVVILGIVITFGITQWRADRAEQRALRQTMQAVVNELASNRQQILLYYGDMTAERRIFMQVAEAAQLSEIPRDTLIKYANVPGSTNSFSLSLFGLPLLQSANLIPSINDTRLTADLFKCYNDQSAFQEGVQEYVAMKWQAITGFVFDHSHRIGYENIYQRWESFLAYQPLHNFIVHSSPGFLEGILAGSRQMLEMLDDMIGDLVEKYRLDEPVTGHTGSSVPLPDSSATGSAGTGTPGMP